MSDDLIFDRSDPEPTNLIAAPGDEVEPLVIELGTGLFAFTHPDPQFGRSNVGLVIDSDGLTAVDTSATPVRGKLIRTRIEELTAELELPLNRVITTSSKVPFTGGSSLFWRAAFYGSEAASDELDQPINHVAIRALLPEQAPAYHDGFETRPITHTVGEGAWLTPSLRIGPVAGESAINIVASAPGGRVVYLGALGSFGVTPLAFIGDPRAWAETLDSVLAIGTTYVPGHGPVGGVGDVQAQADYLRACVSAKGGALPPGPWEEWTNRAFDAVNVERAARLQRGDSSIPTSMFELLGLA